MGFLLMVMVLYFKQWSKPDKTNFRWVVSQSCKAILTSLSEELEMKDYEVAVYKNN